MFKSARWRSEKNKVKVLFKLQFHAAKVPQVGDEALMISVVPADVGKPTVKSDKASVRDGSCFWENPVYETVKFNQDPKSGKIHERIYYFVIGTGSSKAGIIGEASIDFSNYAEATKVSLVSLPLKNSKSEAVLNVSIQRMQEANDQREVEENQNAKSNYKDHSLKSQLASDVDETIKTNSDDVPFNKTVSHITELNGIRRACSESDVTLSSSDSGSGVEIPWQPLGNSGHEATTDESSSTPRETYLTRLDEEETSDIVIEKLKSENAALSRQAEMSELELQTLRKQIVKESKRGQDLFKEVVCLKEERDSLKGEYEKLKVKSKSSFQYEAGDSKAIIEELRQELNHAKEINANLEIQLRKTQEANSELILAVRDLDEMLEQKNREMSLENEKPREADPTYDSNDDDEEQKALEEIVKEHGDTKEAYLLEQQIMDMKGEIEIYKRDRDELEMQMEQLALDYEIMKQENHDMAYKLEQSQIQEQLKMQYECSSSYATAHELETHIERLENEVNRKSKESEAAFLRISELEEEFEKQSQGFKRKLKESEDAFVRISELEEELEKQSQESKRISKESEDAFVRISELEEELEKQSQEFEADLEVIMQSKVEQEQRAIKAEEMLRKTRKQNAKTAEKLQEEFRRLSVQMASTFEANEKLATKSLAEANELRLQKARLEETVKKASKEYKSVKARIEQMQSEIDDRSMVLENEKKHAEKTQSLLSDEILKLKNENKFLFEEIESKETLMCELEEMRKSIKEMELIVEQGNAERIELEKRILLVKNEAEATQKEINKLRCLVDEKESQLDSLQSQYTELKDSRLEDELEKEKLKKQVALLKSDLKKKEDAIKATLKASKTIHRGSKDVSNLKERIKLLEGQIMLKETALETSSNAFREKEKDLHNKIEELEGRLEELNQSSIRYCENEAKKSRNEMELLKERNIEMEEELKEMQERYSEISLKFAEVEGERQQLVMKVRNLKNAKKKAANNNNPVNVA